MLPYLRCSSHNSECKLTCQLPFRKVDAASPRPAASLEINYAAPRAHLVAVTPVCVLCLDSADRHVRPFRDAVVCLARPSCSRPPSSPRTAPPHTYPSPCSASFGTAFSSPSACHRMEAKLLLKASLKVFPGGSTTSTCRSKSPTRCVRQIPRASLSLVSRA